MSGTGDGYIAASDEIRRERGGQAADEAAFVEDVRDDVQESFAAAGRPMGHDQYGAELEKHFPQLKERIFAAFDAYIEELDGLYTGLRKTAANYEAAEDPRFREPGQG
ncbi:hypothetical protein FAF44_49335 [Nonomuraea sp. MG754425]|uniref:hypothetical protein n=1 Tax=Nonomuraea sp. MG754425 TaxID=2570319 RepID=UPI001F38B0CC|nr:hypothetical protein [Nonomuraea sp. MG754425]MCF6476293.1 hypothetical protein [Nonomuraea sp. MG754425]